MYRWVANSIAAVHVFWLLLTLVGPGFAWWVSPLLLAIAGTGNLIWGDCPLFLWEHYWWKRGKCGVYPTSMSKRMFRWIGITLSEEQTGRVIGFLSLLLIIQSFLQLV